MRGQMIDSPFLVGKSTARYTPSIASSDADFSDSEDDVHVATPDGGYSVALSGGGVDLTGGAGIPTPPLTVPKSIAPKSMKISESSASSESTQSDPFVASIGNLKLSATARPFTLSTIAGPAVVATPAVTVPEKSRTGKLQERYGVFSTDNEVSRAIRITSLYDSVQVHEVEDLFHQIGTFSKGQYSVVRNDGVVHIRFNNIFDAQSVFDFLRMSRQDWNVFYAPPNEVSKLVDGSAAYVSRHEGQIHLLARTSEDHEDKDIDEVGIIELLAAQGTIFAYQKQVGQGVGVFKLLIEFADITTAALVLHKWHGKYLGLVALTVTLHRPDEPCQIRRIGSQATCEDSTTPTRVTNGGDNGTLIPTHGRTMALPAFNARDLQHVVSPDAILSPTGRSFINISNHGPPPAFNLQNNTQPGLLGSFPQHISRQHNTNGYNVMGQFGYTQAIFRQHDTSMGYQNDRGLPNTHFIGYSHTGSQQHMGDFRGHRSNSNNRDQGNNGQHNQVDIRRIIDGADVRTTIMLRNIPNKVTQPELKTILDKTSFGLYDFSYLRIDFANNCNVGYAFVNFEDPIAIVAFVEELGGKKWSLYNSDKIAEISYATIQGKDCLIQKFRNSSVMTETPTFRPKLWYTTGHPACGTEEPFPLSDNESKMKRSLDNAEHVGLFAPRGGQQQRDDQRRRHHSQWDRGTRMAEIEEHQNAYPSYGQQYSGYGGGGYYYGAPPASNPFIIRPGFQYR